jgi:hypothetical protein
MIFIIPIILGAAALLTGGLGVASGAEGISKSKDANKIGKTAQKRYEFENSLAEKRFKITQSLAEEYGQLQIQVKLQTIGRLVTFIQRIGQRASQSDMNFLEGLEGFSPQQIQEYKAAAFEAEHFATGGFKAVGTAFAASQGTLALVGLFGTASTGAAISGLSGVAASNATLAWLGGGSLAVGGGGMALGTAMLAGIAAGPALMIGGFVLGGAGEKALTKARCYEAKVNAEIEKIIVFKDFLGQVERRIDELKYLVNSLNNRAIESLIVLESKVFVSSGILLKDSENSLAFETAIFLTERDAVKFQEVALLIKALSEIMKTPILDNEGKINQATKTLKEKYRTI